MWLFLRCSALYRLWKYDHFGKGRNCKDGEIYLLWHHISSCLVDPVSFQVRAFNIAVYVVVDHLEEPVNDSLV